MDIDRLNKWLSLGANIGIILGLVFLIAELNQNSDMMRSQTRHAMVMNDINIPFNTAINPEFASLRMRADKDIGELSPEELYRYRNLAYVDFRYMEDIYYQYKNGLFDESEYLAYRETSRRFINGSKTAASYWCERRNEFSPEFAEEINLLLSEENQC